MLQDSTSVRFLKDSIHRDRNSGDHHGLAGGNGKWLLLTGHRVSVLPGGKVPQFACTAM